ncbi:HlyD family efflux transporter periplasmic adaptor subunit [Coleofasciculus sp. FACHB-1120]|uniref:HlyD family efflux transporter periplasmic adaptor subunit n=1 Tax=Coleofasciculus sp. FACHB-1120 TaxID=2692783 RepID=UPI0016883EAA|nr:HlyD family efflux transporter periplasmic adaptor subunit [Coleofasciculus sp. FACHB-1120]MBD2740558.1 HlyD family efflux transporter periplasmic adaptor subunit [Coleofasciculus sp. FACHB-1120]
MEKRIVPISTSESLNPPATLSAKFSDNSWQDLPVHLSDDTVTDKAASIYGGTAVSVPPPQSERESSGFSLRTRAANQEPKHSAPASGNWSTSLQNVLDQPPSTLPRKLVLGGLVFCVTFGTWASFGQIDEVGHAQGRLVPKGEVYKIDPVELGKVANIAVKEGQAVKAGQVLVELDTQIATGEVERLQQLLGTTQIELTQKQTLIEKVHQESATRGEIAKADVEAATAAIAQVKAKAAAAQKLLTQYQADAAASLARLERLKPLSSTAQELLAQRQADAAAAAAEVERLKPLVKEGAIAQKYLFDAQQVLRDRQSAITKNKLEEDTGVKEQLFQAEQALRDRQRLITDTQGELQQTQAQAEQLQAGLHQKEAEARRTQLEAQQQIQQLEVEITQLKAKIAENQNLLASAKSKLKQRFLYAPVDGVVSSLNINNTGVVVQPGQTVAELAADKAPLILSASLPNQEAGFVKAGMPVNIKFDAFPYQEYGIVSGKVLSVSPDAKPNERLGAVYRVEVELDRNSVTANNQTIHFKAGQTATADIIIRHRRIADILLDPIRQLQKGGINL